MLRLLHLCLLASVATVLWSAPCAPVRVLCNPTTTTTTTTRAPCATTTTPALAPCQTTTAAYNPCGVNTVVAQTEAPLKEFNNGKISDNIKVEEVTVSTTAPVLKVNNETRCRDGWTRYKESCYYIERDQTMSLRDAEQQCLQMNAALFVPNTKEEFETIFENAPSNTWTWLGLFKQSEEMEPHWHVKEAFDFTKLNWLNNNPYGDAINGWSPASQCAGHYNPFTKSAKYVFWYPCNYGFHYVCERNSTLFNKIQAFF